MPVIQFILSANFNGIRRYVFGVDTMPNKIKLPKYTDDLEKALKFDTRHIAGAFRSKLSTTNVKLEVEEYLKPPVEKRAFTY